MTDNISQKDKKDWENFLSKNERLPNKDIKIDKKIIVRTKSIDLHGYSLEKANKLIEDFIIKSYREKINKLIVVTGMIRQVQSFCNIPCLSMSFYQQYSIPLLP